MQFPNNAARLDYLLEQRLINGDVPVPITPGVAVEDATDADDVVDQLNALLASLRAVGFISEDSEDSEE